MADRDVIEILTADHREVGQLFAQIEACSHASDDTVRERRADLVDQVIIELIRHSVAEETEVYPALAERVSTGEADRARHEHAEAEETMKQIDRMSPDDPGYEEALGTLMRDVRQHVQEEESDYLPHLRTAFSAEELQEMGRKVERVKAVAPTRPHPAAPDTPPANKLLGPAAGLLDRMRDAISGRGVR